MPITRSAKKALRQTKRRTLQNLKRANAYKTAVKNIQKMVGEKNLAEARKILPLAYQAIDKAAKAGVIKKNAAARRKSQVARLLK